MFNNNNSNNNDGDDNDDDDDSRAPTHTAAPSTVLKRLPVEEKCDIMVLNTKEAGQCEFF